MSPIPRMKFDSLSVADLFADLIVVGSDRPEFGQVEKIAESYCFDVGGSAAIFAAQIAKLGGRAGLIGALGDDPFGAIIRKRLTALGVDISHVTTSATGKTPLGLNLSVGPDRAMLSVMGCLSEVGPARLPTRLWELTGHLHVAGFFLLESLQPHWPAVLRAARANGVSTSLDTNWAPHGDWQKVQALLPEIDLFLPNENEAMAITGENSAADAGRVLSKYCPLVVIKMGRRGACAFARDRSFPMEIPADALRDLRVVDTTGAGDSFDAGFVWAWLRKEELHACLDLALRCGTASTAAQGGVAAQYTGKSK